MFNGPNKISHAQCMRIFWNTKGKSSIKKKHVFDDNLIVKIHVKREFIKKKIPKGICDIVFNLQTLLIS